MAGAVTNIGLSVITLAAIFYQTFFKALIFEALGVARVIQPITDFPYNCRRIHDDPSLQACEDMWFHKQSQQLFLACSDSVSRREWIPNIGRLNASVKGVCDNIIALKVDHARGSSYEHRVLKTPDFEGVSGDGTLGLVSITGQICSSKPIRLWLVDTRPSISPSGELLDNAKIGSNSTSELFEIDTNFFPHEAHQNLQGPADRHLRGHCSYGRRRFLLHQRQWSSQSRARVRSDVILGGSGVWYCDVETDCRKVAGDSDSRTAH